MKTLSIITGILLWSLTAQGQETIHTLAHSGAKGLFVLAGEEIAAAPGTKRQGYRIERREAGKGDFKQVAELAAVSTVEDFRKNMARVQDWLPYPVDLSVFRPDSIWKIARPTGSIRVLRSIGYSLPILAGFNLIWLDESVQGGQTYEYRITGIGDDYQLLSGEVDHAPDFVAPVDILSHKFNLIENIQYIYAGSTGRNKPLWIDAYRSEEGGPFVPLNAEMFFSSKGDSLQYTMKDSSAQPYRIYRYYLKGYDLYGNASPLSDTVSVATLDKLQRPLPQKVLLEADTARNSITLSWEIDAAPVVNSVTLLRSLSSAHDFEPIAVLPPEVTTYTDEGLRPATAYFYTFEVTYKTLEGSSRGITYGQAFSSPRVPEAPQQVNVLADSSGIDLTWRAEGDYIHGFRVYRGEQEAPMHLISDLVYNQPDSTGMQTWRDTTSSLTGSRYYRYAVRAVTTSYVEGLFSDTVRVRPLTNIPVPSPALHLELQNTEGKAWVSWGHVADYEDHIYGYRVLRSTAPSGTERYITDTLYTAVNFIVDSTCQEGFTYRYRVITLSELGTASVPSEPIYYSSAHGSAPPPPTSLSVTYDEEKGIRLQWVSPAMAEDLQYHVYRYERGQEPSRIVTLPGDLETYTDTTAKEGKLYFYFVRSVGKNAVESDRSNEAGIRNSE